MPTEVAGRNGWDRLIPLKAFDKQWDSELQSSSAYLRPAGDDNIRRHCICISVRAKENGYRIKIRKLVCHRERFSVVGARRSSRNCWNYYELFSVSISISISISISMIRTTTNSLFFWTLRKPHGDSKHKAWYCCGMDCVSIDGEAQQPPNVTTDLPKVDAIALQTHAVLLYSTVLAVYGSIHA
jgi:hypothetical protein